MDRRVLEYRLLYAVVVAGKSAAFAEQAMKQFLKDWKGRPFDLVRRLVEDRRLGKQLREARVGNYGKIEQAFEQIVKAKLQLETCTPEDLEKIHGIGPKTSRFFILWTRPDAQYAALDVHILRWMRSIGYDAPRSTPQDPKKYAALEKAFLKEAKKRGMKPSELDWEVWKKGSGYKE